MRITRKSDPLSWNFVLLIGIVLVLALPRFALQMADMRHQVPPIAWLLFSLAQLALALVLLVFLGGFRYGLDESGVKIKMGVLNIPIQVIPLANITNASVVKDFSPRKVFYGYGLRKNRMMRLTGYCVTKGDAVRIDTADWAYMLVMPEAKSFLESLNQARHRL